MHLTGKLVFTELDLGEQIGGGPYEAKLHLRDGSTIVVWRQVSLDKRCVVYDLCRICTEHDSQTGKPYTCRDGHGGIDDMLMLECILQKLAADGRGLSPFHYPIVAWTNFWWAPAVSLLGVAAFWLAGQLVEAVAEGIRRFL